MFADFSLQMGQRLETLVREMDERAKIPPALVEKLGPTIVTYEIEQAGDAVKLTMLQSHDRAISDDILSGGRQGWPAILSSLKSVLETGNPLAIKMAPPQRMLDALKEMGIGTP